MNEESPEYINVLQHRQLEKQVYSQSFTGGSQLNDSNSISSLNASKLAADVFEENQRLISKIEHMKQNYRNEIRKLREEFDEQISKFSGNEIKYTTLLQEKDDIIRDLRQQILQANKDSLIQQQNEQIQKLNSQYENAIDSRCFQVEKLQAALDKIDSLTKENQLLRQQISGINLNSTNSNSIDNSPKKYTYYPSTSSPFKTLPSQTQTQFISNINSSSFIPNERTFNSDYESNYSNIRTPVSPDIRYGKKRAPPNHPALKEQIPYYFNQTESFNQANEAPLDGFTFTLRELKTTLNALLSERAEVERRLSQNHPVENTKYFAGPLLQKEKDEKHLDELDRMIGRIRLELRSMGKL